MKLLKFYASWCGPCRQQTNIIKQLQTKEEFSNVTLEEFDVDNDENEELITKYNVRGLPVLIFIENDKEIKRFTGLTQQDELLTFIKNGKN